VRVVSELPTADRAATAQRTRWEHGHLRTLLTQSPRLFAAGVRRCRPDLLGLSLELSVPPLSMLVLLWAFAVAVLTVVALLGGPAAPAVVLGAAGVAAGLALFAAWFRYGRGHVRLSSLLVAPFYVVGKVPIYLAFLFRRQRAWVRTERDPARV